jgi:hypothetical protein
MRWGSGERGWERRRDAASERRRAIAPDRRTSASGRRATASERGQATIEWVGLLLGLALLLAAVAAGGREATNRESAHELGEAVAERITCAARDACEARGRLRAAPGPRRDGLRAAPDERRDGLRAAPDGLHLAPRRSRESAALGDSAPVRAGKGALKRGWMLCLGYRRWQYEREHPLTPRQSVPIRETAKMLNECVNPLSFLFG